MSEENQIVLLDIYHSIIVNMTLLNLICENDRCLHNEKIISMSEHYNELKLECEEALYKYGVDLSDRQVTNSELSQLRERIENKSETENQDIAELFYVFSKMDRDNIKERLAEYHRSQRGVANSLNNTIIYTDQTNSRLD